MALNIGEDRFKMNPRVAAAIGTVFVAVTSVASILSLTLLLRVDSSHKDALLTQHRMKRQVGGIQEYGSNLSSPDILEAGIDQPPFVSKYRNFSSASVTTDTDICSGHGIEILRDRGGSVVDAGIATALCVGIVNAHSCGIGGGHFATIYERPKGESEKVVVALIARTRAPGFSTEDMFVNRTGASTIGGLAVAIPGEVNGFYEAWKRFGRLPWSDLFQPAIRLCDQGFKVEPPLSKALASKEESIRNDRNLRELFVKSDNSLVKTGDLLINRKLGATLRAIAADPFAFYNGTLAEDIVEDLREYGANITLNDLNSYYSEAKKPVSVTLDNGRFKMFNPPPPSSGAVMDFILNILDGYNFSSANVGSTESKILTYHRIIEAFKFAYAKRSQLGDEDFVNVSKLLTNLTSDVYAEEIRQQIDDSVTHDVSYYGPTFDVKLDSGTAHLNILAPDGAALALTTSINFYFGAMVRGNRTGIIFNNDMDDFSTPGTRNSFGIPASPTNHIKPGKMPMSSMCPSLVLDGSGSVVFTSGASGGTFITTSTAFVTMNSLWFDLNLGNATDAGRFHHQLIPNEVAVEFWLSSAIIKGLREKNHTVVPSSTFAVVGSIRNRCPAVTRTPAGGACIEAVSDGRKWGTPDGYASQTLPMTTTMMPTIASTCQHLSNSGYFWCIGLITVLKVKLF